jgi:amidase
MTSPPLHSLGAARVAALIASGQVSCVEVMDAHLARIQQLNTSVNAVTVVLEETAREAARAADQATVRGVLHGVPFTVKESLDCLGSATTFGLLRGAGALPYVDAPSVGRLRAAGAIPVGRTNMGELGMRMCTDNPLRGRTHNPWQRSLTVGGSSGGDAAAVAVGMTPLGLGSDMGGSLRVPAACCGVAALKATSGRIASAASLEPRDQGFAGQVMTVEGPLARRVEDLSLALEVLAGRDVRDPRSVSVALRGPSPEEKRAALVTQLPGGPLEAAAVAAIRQAGRLLERVGWIVEENTPPEVERVGELWHKLVATDVKTMLPLVEPLVTPELCGHLRRLVQTAGLEGVPNFRLHAERSRLTRAWSGFFTEYPVIVGPNLLGPVWNPDADLDVHHGLDMLRQATRFILPASVLGFPAVALPMGVLDGVPQGIQFMADLWREDLCLQAAALVEAGVEPITPTQLRW